MAPTPTTEIAILELTPGANPLDQSNPAATIFQNELHTISEQPGYQRMAWGIAEEAQNMLVLLIDWENIEAHHNFINAPHYQTFLANFSKILAGPPTLFHAAFPEWAEPATNAMTKWSAPVTECFFTYYPAETATPELQKELGAARIKFLKELTSSSEIKMRSAAGAWSVEEHVEVSGKKVKPYAVLIGWDSVDDHMKARETKVFGEHAHLIRDGKSDSMVLYHVKFNIY